MAKFGAVEDGKKKCCGQVGGRVAGGGYFQCRCDSILQVGTCHILSLAENQ